LALVDLVVQQALQDLTVYKVVIQYLALLQLMAVDMVHILGLLALVVLVVLVVEVGGQLVLEVQATLHQ
jgi:hypothetical protein